jgi:hypothetical protein
MNWRNLHPLIVACATLALGTPVRAQPGGTFNFDNKTNRESLAIGMSAAFVVPETTSTNTSGVSVAYDYLSQTGTNYTYVEGLPDPIIEPIEIGRIYTNDTAVAWRIKLETNFPALSCGVHGPAAVNQRGPLLLDFGLPVITPNILTIVTWPNGLVSSTNYSLDYVATNWFTPDQMRLLEAGMYYVQLASSNFPNGDIRAQISKQPVLSQPRFKPDGAVGFVMSKSYKETYLIEFWSSSVEVSTNTINWTVLTNLDRATGLFDITDPDATNSPSRFYRAKTTRSP